MRKPKFDHTLLKLRKVELEVGSRNREERRGKGELGEKQPIQWKHSIFI